VPEDKLDALGPALSEVGLEMVAVAGGDTTGLYLHAEAGEGWVGPSLFRDEGDRVSYLRLGRSKLGDLIITARETEPDLGKRWSVMEYVIEDGKYEAKFKFPDEVDVEGEGDSIERRDAFLKARYGEKPVVYPELEGDFFELRPEGE
jgi:hypothetical protein